MGSRAEYRTEEEGNREMSEGRPQQGALRKAQLRTGGAAEGTGQKAGKDISARTRLPKDMFPKNSLVVRIKGKITKEGVTFSSP